MPRHSPKHDQELEWSRHLERGRLSSSLAGGTRLPGPGAAAAASLPGPKSFAGSSTGSPAKPLPELPGKKDKETGQQKASSSIETAKTLAKAASGTGWGQLIADEAEKLSKFFESGSALASAKALWYLLNKYLPMVMIFFAYSLLFEEPFLTVPSLLLLCWVWVSGSHWLKIKWLRNFNNLELLGLFTVSMIYVAAITLIVILIGLLAGVLFDGASVLGLT